MNQTKSESKIYILHWFLDYIISLVDLNMRHLLWNIEILRFGYMIAFNQIDPGRILSALGDSDE